MEMKRQAYFQAAAVFLAALALRLLYVQQLGHTHFFAPFKGGYDDYIFDAWALEILSLTDVATNYVATDEVTGVSTRRHFLDRAQEEVQRVAPVLDVGLQILHAMEHRAVAVELPPQIIATLGQLLGMHRPRPIGHLAEARARPQPPFVVQQAPLVL